MPMDKDSSGVPAPPDQAAHDPERWHTLWAETWGDYYSPTIAVSETTGAIRIEAGGRVVVKPVRAWIDAVWPKDEPPRAARRGPQCEMCQGRGWVMHTEHHDLGNGLASGGAWNEPCSDCASTG